MRAIPIAIAALIIVAGPLKAQTAPIHVEWLSVEDGLPGTGITDIVQDPTGYLWFATFFGVARYDGIEFDYFQPDPFEPDALPRSRIFDLFDAGTHMWIAAETSGLFRFDYAREEMSRLDIPASAESSVVAVHEQPDGTLWIGASSSGLHRRSNSGEWTHFAHNPDNPFGISSNHIEGITEDSRETLWISSGNGLNRFIPDLDGFQQLMVDPREPTTPRFSPTDLASYPVAATRALVEVSDGSFWLGTGHGLVHLNRDGGVIRTLGLEEGLPDTWIHSLFLTEDGGLWAGTRLGPVIIDLATLRVETIHLGGVSGKPELDRFVLSFYRDHSGVLWMGTAGALVKAKTFSDHFQTIPLPISAPASIVEDPIGRVWVGGDEGTLAVWNPDTGTSRVESAELRRAGVRVLRDMLVDAKGRLVIGTMGQGIFRFLLPAPGSRRLEFVDHLGTGDGLGGEMVYSLEEDRDGVLWVGGQWGLDRVAPDNSVRSMRHDSTWASSSLPPGPIMDVKRDRNGGLWVATLNGLARSTNEGATFILYPHIPGQSNSPSHRFTYTVAPDADGSVWFGTYGGLDRWNPATANFEHVILDPRLPLTSAVCVLSGVDVWASTFSGIGRVIYGSGRTVHYGREQGIQVVDFANGSACHQGPSGRIYYSGRFLLYTADPSTFRDNLSEPKVAISSVSVGVEAYPAKLWPGETRKLSPRENDLTFELSGFHYEEPERMSFAYRILRTADSPDIQPWIEMGSSRSIRLSLQPGSYTFEARSESAMGITSPPTQAHFVIGAPWWMHQLFWSGVAMAMALVLAAGYRMRLYHLGRRTELLKRVVRERTVELREAKDRTEQQALRLVQLDRSKSHFFANVSHEFRTPLTLILGPLQDLLDGRRSLDDLSRDAPIMHRNALRLLRLINQILDLSRLEAGALDVRPSRTDLVGFLRGLVLGFASHAEREHVALMFQSTAKQCLVLMDKDKLEKVVSNLLVNSLAFTPRRGKVLVQLEMEDTCTSCAIHVSDTGPGIPADRIEHVFERFYHVDSAARRANEGAGIGLALARELTELLGGSISVSSRVGFGTDFVIRLPLTRVGLDQAAAILQPVVENTTPVSEHLPEQDRDEPNLAPTVLVVEDNDDMRNYLTSTLGRHFQVVGARDGEDGLRKAHAAHPDLIVSDIVMPKLDGFGLCRAVRDDAGLESTPIILLTARADAESRLEGLSCSADDYLSKPIRASELVARVDNLLRSRSRLRHRFEQHIVVEPTDLTVDSQEAEFLQDLLSVIENHLGDSTFAVDWLADDLGVGRRQLERRVHELMDRTPGELIRQMRVQRATQLLRAHAGTVSEIAYMVGFRSPSHFSRVYKDLTGTTPSEVRSQPLS